MGQRQFERRWDEVVDHEDVSIIGFTRWHERLKYHEKKTRFVSGALAS
jgi:hypothetical protein